MSDSSPEDSSLLRSVLEDTPSTPSTPSTESSDKSSPAASSLRRIIPPLVSPPGANLQRANSALASSPVASNPQDNLPLAGTSEPVYPRATPSRPIPLRSSPPARTLLVLIFPRPSPPPVSSPQAIYPQVDHPATTSPQGSTPRANPQRTDSPETDPPGPSRQPMTTCPNLHHLPQHGDVHSIFLRAFHSPWSGIGRRLALAIRGFVSLYMTVTFMMVVAWQARTDEAASMVMFKFETISFLWQVAYSWITFVS